MAGWNREVGGSVLGRLLSVEVGAEGALWIVFMVWQTGGGDGVDGIDLFPACEKDRSS